MLSVILAGGVGERFWPRSRRSTPKQLLDLTGDGPMIRLTVERTLAVSKPEEIFILTNVAQEEAIAEAVGDVVPRANVVGEPVGRNTAASVGLAALLVRERFGDSPFMVLPADHVVGDMDQYQAAVAAADAYTSAHAVLLTFGITPTRPEIGYGYIELGSESSGGDGERIFEVESFHEKPDIATAESYIAAGNFLWNSGMFCWRPSVILDAISRFAPDLAPVLDQLAPAVGTPGFGEVLNNLYAEAPAVSIDYAVMEKADNVVVLEGNFFWNDVGNWESVREVYAQDGDGNVASGDHVFIDSSDNTVIAPDKVVGIVGLENVIVVDGGDSILICDRSRAQEVRGVVEVLKKRGRGELY